MGVGLGMMVGHFNKRVCPTETGTKSLNATIRLRTNIERIRQYDSSDTGHSDNANIVAEHQEPAEVLSQLHNTSNSPVYGEYKCC